MTNILQRSITYISGTRADFGLMSSVLNQISSDPRLNLDIIVTGMHLSERYGMTVREIENQCFSISSRIPVDVSHTSGAVMASNIGHMLIGFVSALENNRPDILLLLGDRGEMLAAAIAAAHLSIPIAHLHGGELSGTIDEPIRHAISKLSSLHLVATSASRDRLIRMGEHGDLIHVVGAPGIDGLPNLVEFDRFHLCDTAGFNPDQPVALLLYHPVLTEASDSAQQVSFLVEAAVSCGLQILALMPNSDAGSDDVRSILTNEAHAGRIKLRTHLKRSEFVSWMATADIMIGNSSSGIIESATFGTPVINVGSRQYMRERNPNVIDVTADLTEIRRAIALALSSGRYQQSNLYGDGSAGTRIVDLLAAIDLSSLSTSKFNAY